MCWPFVEPWLLVFSAFSVTSLAPLSYEFKGWDGDKSWIEAKDSTEETLFQTCPCVQCLRLMVHGNDHRPGLSSPSGLQLFLTPAHFSLSRFLRSPSALTALRLQFPLQAQQLFELF